MRTKREININEIKSLYNSGLTLKEIGKKMNFSSVWIAKKMEDNGITRRTQAEVQRKYTLDQSFFEKIDTEEKAYFLGWLFSDGHNNVENRMVALSIQERDIEILYKLNKLINSNAPIRTIKSNSEKRQNIRTLTFCSKKMSLDLLNIGMKQKKVHCLEYPNLKENLNKHFIRGYFDGDGSFSFQARNPSRGRWSVSSTKSFCLKVKEILEDLDIKVCGPFFSKNTKSTYYVNINKRKDLMKIFNFIYDNPSIKLERKYNKFSIFKDNYLSMI